MIESAKSRMRDHFKFRGDEKKRTIVQGWKDQQVDPYTEEPAEEPAKAPSPINLTEVKWGFVVVSTDLNTFAVKEAAQFQREPGLVSVTNDGRVRVWIKTWAQVIGHAEHRHSSCGTR